MYAFPGQVSSGWVEAGGAVELVAHGMRGESAGGLGDGGGEGFFGVGETGGIEDEAAIVAAAAGHTHVDTGPAGARFNDAEGVVGGDALGAVPGDRPAKFDVLGDVVGREPHGPTIGVSEREDAVASVAVTVQVWRFRTATPRSVTSGALRRVAIRSHRSARVPSASPTARRARRGWRRRWISRLMARAVDVVPQ